MCDADPTITTTLFRVPQCREISDHWFHEDDFSIDCTATRFFTVGAIAICLIIAVPVGVPVGFLFFMRRGTLYSHAPWSHSNCIVRQ